jgi:hypothetical protein
MSMKSSTLHQLIFNVTSMQFLAPMGHPMMSDGNPDVSSATIQRSLVAHLRLGRREDESERQKHKKEIHAEALMSGEYRRLYALARTMVSAYVIDTLLQGS